MSAKRLFDVAVCLLLLPLLALPMLGLALWVRLDSPGPALFRQTRVGRGGRLFRIHKFRTMRHDGASGADGADSGSAPQITAAGDVRITRAGRWLRRSKLDELPQLIDVLKGDMSLVGPRPEVPRYMTLYPPEARARILSLRPGLTDRAAIAFRDEEALLAAAADPERTYIETIMPRKQALYLQYAAQHSLADDCRILWETLRAVWRRA